MGKNNAKLFSQSKGKPIPSDALKLLLEDLTPEQESALPRGWQVIGEVLLVHVPDVLQPRKRELGEALLSLYPRCKTVVETKRIAGTYREPISEVIAGDGTGTIHKENYVLFKLDVAKIMFSQGNFYERRRMSTVGAGEHVVDMFAGIGYFTMPMAVHARPRRIDAIELNPVSFEYLKENVRLNHVEDIVNPILGDCREKAPVGEADRVIMGYVGTTQEYLPWGVKALKPGGILHYHETTPEKLVFERPIRYVEEAAEAQGRSAEIVNTVKVKKYSPGVWHVVVDAKITAFDPWQAFARASGRSPMRIIFLSGKDTEPGLMLRLISCQESRRLSWLRCYSSRRLCGRSGRRRNLPELISHVERSKLFTARFVNPQRSVSVGLDEGRARTVSKQCSGEPALVGVEPEHPVVLHVGQPDAVANGCHIGDEWRFAVHGWHHILRKVEQLRVKHPELVRAVFHEPQPPEAVDGQAGRVRVVRGYDEIGYLVVRPPVDAHLARVVLHEPDIIKPVEMDIPDERAVLDEVVHQGLFRKTQVIHAHLILAADVQHVPLAEDARRCHRAGKIEGGRLVIGFLVGPEPVALRVREPDDARPRLRSSP